MLGVEIMISLFQRFTLCFCLLMLPYISQYNQVTVNQ